MQLARWMILTAFAAPLLFAAPCIPDTLADYESLAPGSSGGCMVGPIDFHDFGFALTAASGGAVPVAAADVTVTPVTGPFTFGLTFASNGFSVTSGQFIQYLLSYTADPPPPIIHGFSLSLAVDGPVPPGLDDITSVECLDAAFSGTVCPTSTVTVHVFDNGVTSSLDSSVVFAPVITLGVQTTITLDASKGGSADFASITETVVTPEPAYALPAALCLAVIALRRRLASEIHKTQRCPDDRNQR